MLKTYQAKVRSSTSNAVFPVTVVAENKLDATNQINAQYGAQNIVIITHEVHSGYKN